MLTQKKKWVGLWLILHQSRFFFLSISYCLQRIYRWIYTDWISKRIWSAKSYLFTKCGHKREFSSESKNFNQQYQTRSVLNYCKMVYNFFSLTKGQIISKRFFFSGRGFFQKRTKTIRILVKTNSFVRFLRESSAWQFAFEINWPLSTELTGNF